MPVKVCYCGLGGGFGSFPHEHHRMQHLKTHFPRKQGNVALSHITPEVMQWFIIHQQDLAKPWCWHLKHGDNHWYFPSPLWIAIKLKEKRFASQVTLLATATKQAALFSAWSFKPRVCLPSCLLETTSVTEAFSFSMSVPITELKVQTDKQGWQTVSVCSPHSCSTFLLNNKVRTPSYLLNLVSFASL